MISEIQNLECVEGVFLSAYSDKDLHSSSLVNSDGMSHQVTDTKKIKMSTQFCRLSLSHEVCMWPKTPKAVTYMSHLLTQA